MHRDQRVDQWNIRIEEERNAYLFRFPAYVFGFFCCCFSLAFVFYSNEIKSILSMCTNTHTGMCLSLSLVLPFVVFSYYFVWHTRVSHRVFNMFIDSIDVHTHILCPRARPIRLSSTRTYFIKLWWKMLKTKIACRQEDRLNEMNFFANTKDTLKD